MTLGVVERFDRADPDLAKGHPLLQERWPRLERILLAKYGWKVVVIEVYRPELRQMWLYGQGRTAAELAQKGIRRAGFARPQLKRVTNAWSARVSAHGVTIRGPAGTWVPAAAALDVVPVGADDRPWTVDDPWDPFVVAIAAEGPTIGLVHFHGRNKGVTDRPHLQLWPEWSDSDHRLHLAA